MPHSHYRPSRSSSPRSRHLPKNERTRSNRTGARQPSSTKSESKTSLWSKILGFFGIKTSKSTHRPGSTHSTRSPHSPPATSVQSSRPEPEPLKPESITNQRLYVGNLSYDTTESDLYDIFTRYGVVKNVEVIFDRRTQRSKGFAFVEMETLDAAQKAAVALHRIEFMGRTIVVSSAKADPAASPIDAAHEKSATYISNPTPTTTPSSPIESDAKASDTSTQEAATPPAASAPPPPSPNQKLT